MRHLNLEEITTDGTRIINRWPIERNSNVGTPKLSELLENKKQSPLEIFVKICPRPEEYPPYGGQLELYL